MRKCCLAFLFLFGGLLSVTAQRNQRDSLLQVLGHQKQDTNRVNSLLALAKSYYILKPDSALPLAVEALSLSKQLNFKEGTSYSLAMLGMTYGTMGNYPKSIGFILQSLQKAERNNDSAAMVRAYTLLGACYREQGSYEMSLYYFGKGKSEATGRPLISVLAGMCETFVELNKPDSARVYGQQALDLAYELKNSRLLGWTLFEMAYAHLIAQEYPLALEYFRMSIPLSLSVDDYLGMCKEYRGIAQVFAKTGHRDSSLYYGRLALNFSRENHLFREAMKASSLIASFYRTEHNADSALAYMDVSKAIGDSIFSQQNQNQIQAFTFDEKLRQIEREETERKEQESRKHNLQYAAIVLGMVALLICFLVLSHSILANQKLIRFLGVVSLLIVFEFLNLWLHPFLGQMTHESPVWMLLIMVGIAAILVPMHHRLEHWMTHKLVEKNNKIRLAAAKKTIAQLEGTIQTL